MTPFRRISGRLAWFGLFALSGYYLYRAINYRFLTPNRLAPDLFNKQLWYFGHLAPAPLAAQSSGCQAARENAALSIGLLFAAAYRFATTFEVPGVNVATGIGLALSSINMIYRQHQMMVSCGGGDGWGSGLKKS